LGPRTGDTLLKDLQRPDSLIKGVIDLTTKECKGTMCHYIGKGLINVISSLTGIYLLGQPLVRSESKILPFHFNLVRCHSIRLGPCD
jgi:hypothetical protein